MALGAYGRYGQSKLAMILWVKDMAKRYPQITFASIHPDVVQTELLGRETGLPFPIRVLIRLAQKTNLITTADQAEGVKNQLWASVAGGVKSGEYYEPIGISGMETALAKNEELAGETMELDGEGAWNIYSIVQTASASGLLTCLSSRYLPQLLSLCRQATGVQT